MTDTAAEMASGETLAEMIRKRIAYFNSNLKEPLSAKDEEAVAGATRYVERMRTLPQADVPCEATGQPCRWVPNIHGISPYFCKHCRREDPRDVYDLYEGRLQQMHERRAGHQTTSNTSGRSLSSLPNHITGSAFYKSDGTAVHTPKAMEEPCMRTDKGCTWAVCCDECNDVYCQVCGRYRDWDADEFKELDAQEPKS